MKPSALKRNFWLLLYEHCYFFRPEENFHASF